HWGDGATDTYTTAQLNAMGRQVSHIYLDGTANPPATVPTTAIRVDLIDNDPVDPYHESAGSKDIIVYNVAPTASFGVGSPVNEGSTGTALFFNQQVVSVPDTVPGFTYRYDFDNDGLFDTPQANAASRPIPASFLA